MKPKDTTTWEQQPTLTIPGKGHIISNEASLD